MKDIFFLGAVFIGAIILAVFLAITWVPVGRAIALQLVGPRPTDKRVFFWIVLTAGGWLTFALSLFSAALLRMVWFFKRSTGGL